MWFTRLEAFDRFTLHESEPENIIYPIAMNKNMKIYPLALDKNDEFYLLPVDKRDSFV